MKFNMVLKPHIEIIGDYRDFEDTIETSNQFRPVMFGYTAEHSEYQEFGTGPARGRSSYYIGKKGREALDLWAKRKLGMVDDKERKAFVNKVAWKIGKYGLQPRPFFRPAISTVISDMQRHIDEGKSFQDMAHMIGDISDRLIMQYEMPYDGTIQMSWFVRMMDENAPDDTSKSFMDDIFAEVW